MIKNEDMTVCMGTDFCNRGCRAMRIDWKCCTCGFRIVDQFYHQALGMMVRTTQNGMAHGFCGTCEDIDVTVTTKTSTNDSEDEEQYKKNIRDPPLLLSRQIIQQQR
jgi:hypothetical protein